MTTRKYDNLEVTQKDQNFIIMGLDLLGEKLAPKNRSYTANELKDANELQSLINRVVWLKFGRENE